MTDPLAALREAAQALIAACETGADCYEVLDEVAALRAALAATPPAIDPEDGTPFPSGHGVMYDEYAALAATPPAIDPESVVAAMENEGVVTWGDERHRARFLALATPPAIDPEPDHALHFDPDCEECVYLARPTVVRVPSPAIDPERGVYATEESLAKALEMSWAPFWRSEPLNDGSGGSTAHWDRAAMAAALVKALRAHEVDVPAPAGPVSRDERERDTAEPG